MNQRAEHFETVHVRQHLEGWAVELDPVKRASRVFVSRDYAVTAGQDVAHRLHRDLFVHDGTGQVELVVLYEENSMAEAGRWKRKRTPRRVQPHAA
jgi:Uncharacterized protein conserved in bacteria (DUF2188)